jgi:hypothetical protein
MNYTDWSSKLEQVLKRTDKDTLYDYLCDYAKSHEELAMALIGEFWQTEKDDYKSMVQKCLMHPTKLGAKSHEAYDWTAVACDLAKMMNLAAMTRTSLSYGRCWLHSGSHDAAQNIAFMYSLYESCKMNDIDFGEYVEDILTRMMNGDEDYRSMIPCYYTPGKKQEKKVA